MATVRKSEVYILGKLNAEKIILFRGRGNLIIKFLDPLASSNDLCTVLLWTDQLLMTFAHMQQLTSHNLVATKN